MMRALVMTVGTGRSGEDIASGIYFSIRRNPSDLNCFLVSPRTRIYTLPHVLRLMGVEESDSRIQVVEVDEVNDVETLIEAYKEVFDELIERGFTPENIIVDYTSGTKAMSVALVYAAIGISVETISYVYGRRDETGRVLPGTEKLNLIEPNAAFSERKLNQFKLLFNQYQFLGAIEALGKEPIYYSYRQEADLYRSLAIAYDAWDKFNFELASKTLNEFDLKAVPEIRLAQTIAKHKQLLYRLKSDELNHIKIKDLFFNARRRYEEGKFDDGVARLYRTLEMIAQVEFEDLYDCPTGKVPPKALSENQQEQFRRFFDEEKGVYRLGLLDTFRAIHDKGSETGARFFDHFEEVLKVLGMRNNSILAHGVTPISRAAYERFESVIKDLVEIDGDLEFPKLH